MQVQWKRLCSGREEAVTNKRRKALVTGMGVVSPLGCSLEELSRRVFDGISESILLKIMAGARSREERSGKRNWTLSMRKTAARCDFP